MSHRIDRQLVIDALRMGIWRFRPKVGLIFHSDRGNQYCSHDFLNFLKTHKMLSSMSRKGNYWDNAVAESFFGSLKTERVYNLQNTAPGKKKEEMLSITSKYFITANDGTRIWVT